MYAKKRKREEGRGSRALSRDMSYGRELDAELIFYLSHIRYEKRIRASLKCRKEYSPYLTNAIIY